MMTRRTFAAACAVLAAFVILPAAPAAVQTSRRFTLDDFSSVARVNDPHFSPDAKTIAVVIAHANLDMDRYDPELTLIDVATSTQKVLVKDVVALSSPRWSPDGASIAFLGDPPNSKELQVFVVS